MVNNQLGMVMPPSKSKRYALMDRRKQVMELYLQGKTQWDIARLINVSQGTVCNDLTALRKNWLASALRDFDTLKAEELAKIDNVERAAWDAWECSRKPVGKSEVMRPGDPRFLAQVFECVETRLKILGLLKPGTTTVNTQVNMEMWSALLDGVPAKPQEDRVHFHDAEIARLVEETATTGIPLTPGLQELPLSKRAQQAGIAPTDDQLAERLRRLEAAVNGNGHSTNGTSGGQHDKG